MESKKTYIPEFIYKGSNQLAMIIFVPIFALLFISIYSPFDFDRIDTDTRFLSWLNISRELVVQLITILLISSGMGVAALSRWFMGMYTRHRQMTYMNYIGWIVCEILSMAIIFTLGAVIFTDTDKGVVTLFRNSLIKTFLILLIPYTMCYIYFIWRSAWHSCDCCVSKSRRMSRRCRLRIFRSSTRRVICVYRYVASTFSSSSRPTTISASGISRTRL